MATYGEIRLSLTKQIPGIDPEIWDSYIMGVYQEILDTMSWSRIKTSYVLQTTPEVNGGTITVTPGSQAITANSTASALWSAALNGRMIRIGGGPEFYQFTFESTGVAILDRVYEGEASGAGVGYQINQTVYPLPASVRFVETVRSLENGWELEKKTPADFNHSAANRREYGDPEYWTPTFDQVSSPPVAQIEIYPIPQRVFGIAVDCVVEDIGFGNSSSSVAQVWMRPDCIKSGARSLGEAHMKDWNAATFWGGRFQMLKMQLVHVESERIGAQSIRMAPQFSRHRVVRALNSHPRRIPN